MMEWILSVSCWVLSVVAFLMAPILTLGYSSGSSRLLSSYPNDSTPSIETRYQITVSLLKSQKQWLKKDISKLENKILLAYPLSEDIAEGYNNNSEIRRKNNIQKYPNNSIHTELCWLGVSCEEFSSVTPPHDVINIIPPPPLPLFLFQLEMFPDLKNLEEYLYLMEQLDFQSYYLIEKKNDGEREEKIFRVNPAWLADDVAYGCSLCKWANRNSTEPLFITHNPNEGDSWKWKWIETLVVVGVVSGILGAVFACFLTRIKSWIRTYGESKEKKEPPMPGYTARSDMVYFTGTMDSRRLTVEDTNVDSEGVHLGHSDSQEPQESQESPNSDSEDTYVNGSSVNLRFSQMASESHENESDFVIYYDPMSLRSGVGLGYCSRNGILGMNPESDNACSPEGPSNSMTPTLNPLGTSSTPSSAYYSDMSVLELPSYRKKKKKRKADLERNLRRNSSEVSEIYSPTLAHHLVNIKQPLTLGNEFGIQVHNYYDNIQPSFTHLNISSNYTHNKGKCLHNSPNFIQNRTRLPETSITPGAIFDTTTPSSSDFIPKCIHYTPEYIKYTPSLAIKNTNLTNTSLIHPYSVGLNEETVPALIKHFDKNSAIEYINNNFTSNNTKLTNSIKFSELLEKENCNCVLTSQDSTSLRLDDNSIITENKKTPLGQHHHQQPTNYFNPYTDLYRGEQDIYRVYSSSEVPSEYI